MNVIKPDARLTLSKCIVCGTAGWSHLLPGESGICALCAVPSGGTRAESKGKKMSLVRLPIIGNQVEYINPAHVKRVRASEDGEWTYVIFSNDSQIMVSGKAGDVAKILNGGES